MNSSQKIRTQIIDFLRSINIKVIEQELPNSTFLPGLDIAGGTILMDLTQLKYPGDLLHEAGHIAVTEVGLRPLIGTAEMDQNWPSAGDEIATMLWSFAAAHHLNLDLKIIFHEGGYKNDAEWIMKQYNNNNYLGLPLLQWMSMCSEDTFPKMDKWLR